jgi:cytochrome c oxidase assembly factor CtaG
VGSHLPPLYNRALESDTVHQLEHQAYLVTALMFWWPAIGTDPGPHKPSHPARVLYLLLSMPVMAFLGVAMAGADQLLYPHYAAHAPPWDATALEDQHLAGTLMWIVEMVTMPPTLALVLLQWLDEDDRKHARLTATSRASHTGGTPPTTPRTPERAL